MPTQFLANAVTNPDQLRQKVAFALSQIFVTSINTIIWNDSMIPYEQMLMADAFTNYRQIMGDVTLSPTMGQYLDMANNAMGNPATGTIANQNYAREVMQLFTIGTTMLNPDGSQQLDGNGLPLPTYLQPVIADTARVFTGWTYLPTSGPVEWNDYINPAGPMVPYPSEHDMGSKQLLNGYVGAGGAEPAAGCEQRARQHFQSSERGAVCRQDADPASGEEQSEPGLHFSGWRRRLPITAMACGAICRR